MTSQRRQFMPHEIVYIIRPGAHAASFSIREALEHLGIAEDRLILLKNSKLILIETDGTQEKLSQDTVDQIHNILVLEKVFNIDPRSIRPLYSVFGGFVLSLPIKDTDLYKYSNAELNENDGATRDLLRLIIRTVFSYLKELDKSTGISDLRSSKPYLIRIKKE